MGVIEGLVSTNYPIRRVDDILNSLRNSKYLCCLDLYNSYLHVQVDEESRQIQTVSTRREIYRMNRLSFGIKTAPSEFNRIIDRILESLPKRLSYFHDLIIHGATKEECQKNLELSPKVEEIRPSLESEVLLPRANRILGTCHRI
jgi:hypothetical protein